MKTVLKALVLCAGLLVALTGCELFNAINLAWNIESVTSYSSFARVSYSVRNFGKVDLTGVNLQIGVDVYGNDTYSASAWTPDFSISQNQIIYGTLDVFTGATPFPRATVLSVDMDNPKD